VSSDLSLQLERLVELTRRGARLGLERIEEALAFAGDPQRSFRVVHVAGTNGKGSVSAMLESILRRSGLKTGLYTSPHLCRFNERIRIDGAPIDDASFASVLAAAMDPEMPPLSMFEAITVAAFVAFARAGVDVAVLEVGLGGRLDATNVIATPLVTAITSIGIDHTRFLGEDIPSIAREKAGIAKRGVPLVVGSVDRSAARSIAQVARDRGASSVIWIDDGNLDERSPHATRARLSRKPAGATVAVSSNLELALRPSLAGDHQVGNAAVAAVAAWHLRDTLPGIERHIEEGIAQARWPGRLERLESGNATVLLDCAHNAEGVAALCAHLDGVDPERTRLVFGAIDEKPYAAMLDALAPLARHRHYCRPLDPVAGRRAVEPDVLASSWAGETHSKPAEAIRAALAKAAPGELIVVTGSIFLVGAVRAELLGLGRDPAIPL